MRPDAGLPLFFPKSQFFENAGLFQVESTYDVGFGFPSTLLFFSEQSASRRMAIRCGSWAVRA